VPATIKDIAARLGISHTTVSRALRDFPYVNEELRRRIRETARELNYHPNALARGLKGRRTQVVGLLVPDLTQSYARAAKVMQGTLAAEGYRMLLCVSTEDPQSERAYLRSMLEERVDGLIWIPRTRQPQAVREYAEHGVPIVQFVRTASQTLDAVVADEAGAAQAATQHLLALGHVRIGLIVGQADVSTVRERLEGYRRALETAGGMADGSLARIGMFTQDWGGQATRELLDLERPPTALIVTSAELVIGALLELDRRHATLPTDVSLVGWGEADWFGIWRPPITSVVVATDHMAALSVHTLLQRVNAPPGTPPHKAVVARLGCHLAERASTAAPTPHPEQWAVAPASDPDPPILFHGTAVNSPS